MRRILVLFIIAMLALVACSQTKVVKLDQEQVPVDQNTSVEKQTTQNTSTSLAPSTGGASAATGGKTPVSCDDTDFNDPTTIGLVTVTNSDGSVDKYYDDCAAGSNVEVEYICDGNTVKSKNTICKHECLLIDVKADPGHKVGFCSSQ